MLHRGKALSTLIEAIFILVQKVRLVDFSPVCRTRRSYHRAILHGVEPADDGGKPFYYPAWLHLCLWRRGRTRLARHFATYIVKENNFPACRARVRCYMGAVAPAALVYRRSPESVHAVLGTGDAWNIPVFLAGHNSGALGVLAALHAFSRTRECIAVVVRNKIQLDINHGHNIYHMRFDCFMDVRTKTKKNYFRADRQQLNAVFAT